MTKPFSPGQKYRILVRFDALVLQDGAFTPIAQVRFGTLSTHKRFALCRAWGTAVRCACGCGAWAPLAEIDFDHVDEYVKGGPTAIGNGQPLRRDPCHKAKSAIGAAVTGKVTRTRRKLSVTLKRDAQHSPSSAKRRAWPTRSLQSRPFDTRFRKRFNGTTEARS